MDRRDFLKSSGLLGLGALLGLLPKGVPDVVVEECEGGFNVETDSVEDIVEMVGEEEPGVYWGTTLPLPSTGPWVDNWTYPRCTVDNRWVHVTGTTDYSTDTVTYHYDTT